MISYLILCNIRCVFEVENYVHELSRSELNIVQLEPWFEPAQLGLITTYYLSEDGLKFQIH